MKRHKPRIVRRVTRNHVTRFVSAWQEALPDDALYVAFQAAGVMSWPDRETLTSETTPAQHVYMALEDEILTRTGALVGEAIGRAFQQAATEVLDRVRARRNAAI